MILPNNNISIMDVRNVLGYPSTDLGTLCSCNKINVFSKWKPVNYNGLSINESVLKNMNYGIEPIEANNVETLIRIIDEGGTYTYNKPKGGSLSPYRLGDFRNYNSNAPIPVQPMGSRSIDNAGNAITQLVSIENQGDSTTLGKNDIYHFLDNNGQVMALNRGIYLKHDNGKTAWCTSKIEWAKIPNKAYWQSGEVTCYDFYTNVSKGIGEGLNSSGNDRFYAICAGLYNPNPYRWTLTGDEPAGSKPYYFRITALKNNTNTRVNYELTIGAVGDIYRGGTAQNIALQLHTSLNGTSPINSQVIADSYYIQDEKEYTWDGSLNIPSQYRNSPIFIHVYADQKLQVKTAVMMMPPDQQ